MKIWKTLLAGAALTLAGAASAQTATTPAASAASGATSYIHAGRLLANPANGKVESNKTIVIENGRVTAIRDGFVGEGRVIDLKNAFVLPGLIDSHVHLTSEASPNSRLNAVTLSRADSAIAGAGNAAKTLRAGFTTVADLGASNDAIFALRRGIANGTVAGPRIIASGGAVSVHGGHGDVNGFSDDIMHMFTSPSICSGADDCMRAVRLQVRSGADIIKITSTGGVLSNTAAGLGQQFTNAELAAIVEAAHRMGRLVVAHAHGTDGINAFLRAGGDAIEHGTFLDQESITLFKRPGTWLVPTLMAGDFVARVAGSPGNFFTPAQTQKALEAGPKMLDMARRAHAGGVRIAFGTDTGVSPHGDNAQEFALLVKAGLTPLQAIQTATVNAAEHLRLSNEAGKIAAGMPADIIAVNGDPLTDVTELERVRFVMRAGKPYRVD